MHQRARALSAILATGLAVTATACGSDHTQTAAASRTVEIAMTDNAFTPTVIDAKKGETIRFRFTNNGKTRHEAIVGDEATQMHHHDDMMAAVGTTVAGGHGPMGGGHGPNTDGAITVEPGMSGELTHMFDADGPVFIGCHEPGHWEAGMKATIAIA